MGLSPAKAQAGEMPYKALDAEHGIDLLARINISCKKGMKARKPDPRILLFQGNLFKKGIPNIFD